MNDLMEFLRAAFNAIRRIPARALSALDPYADYPDHPAYRERIGE